MGCREVNQPDILENDFNLLRLSWAYFKAVADGVFIGHKLQHVIEHDDDLQAGVDWLDQVHSERQEY